MATPSHGGRPIQFAPHRGSLSLVARTPARIITDLTAQLPLVANARVVTESIPTESGGTTSGLVLEYDLLVPESSEPAIVKASWEGDLLTGAVLDQYAAGGFGSISEVRANLVDPSGALQPIGAGFGNVVRGQVFSDVPASFGTQVAANATQFGLSDVSVTQVQGLQEAPVVVATTDTPQNTVDALEQSSSLDTLFGGPLTRFEGVYLEVRDTSGVPVYIAATASRAGSSTVWTAPSVRAVGNRFTR